MSILGRYKPVMDKLTNEDVENGYRLKENSPLIADVKYAEVGGLVRFRPDKYLLISELTRNPEIKSIKGVVGTFINDDKEIDQTVELLWDPTGNSLAQVDPKDRIAFTDKHVKEFNGKLMGLNGDISLLAKDAYRYLK